MDAYNFLYQEMLLKSLRDTGDDYLAGTYLVDFYIGGFKKRELIYISYDQEVIWWVNDWYEDEKLESIELIDFINIEDIKY